MVFSNDEEEDDELGAFDDDEGPAVVEAEFVIESSMTAVEAFSFFIDIARFSKYS